MDSSTDLRSHAREMERSDRLPAAAELYTRVALESSGSGAAAAWARVGEVRTRLGDLAGAAESLERASDLFREAGLRNSAIATLQKLAALDPSRVEVHEALCGLTVELRYARDARAAISAVLDLHATAGQPDRAVEPLANYLHHHPEEVSLWVDWIAALRRDGHHEAAVNALDRLARLLQERGSDAARRVRDEVSRLRRRVDLGAAADARPLGGQPGSDAALPPLGGSDMADSPREAGGEAPADSITSLPGLEPSRLDGLETFSHGEYETDADDADELDAPARGGRFDDLLPGLDDAVEGAPAGVADLPLLDGAPELSPSADAPEAGPRRGPGNLPLLDDQEDDPEPSRAADEPGGFEPLPRLDAGLLDAEDTRRLAGVDSEGFDPLPGLEGSSLADAPDPTTAPPEPVEQPAGLAWTSADEPWSSAGVTAEHVSAAGDDLAPRPAPAQPVSIVLDRLRLVLDRSLAPADAETHYDLGIAYKEMGMLDHSLAQLLAALDAGRDPLSTYEVMGEALVGRGDDEMAVDLLREAVRLGAPGGADLVAVHYWLGRASERLGRAEDARSYYRRVLDEHAGFRDTDRRLRDL